MSEEAKETEEDTKKKKKKTEGQVDKHIGRQQKGGEGKGRGRDKN